MSATKMAKPKASIMYAYGIAYKCYVACYPQQRWEYKIDNRKVELRRKGISIVVSEDDFKKNWKEVSYE